MMKRVKLNKYKIGAAVFMLGLLTMLYTSCKKEEKEIASLPASVSQYYPNSGNAGTLVNIEGKGFGVDKNKITATIDGKAVDILAVQDDRIVLQIPEGGNSGLIILKVNDEQFEVGQYSYQSLSLQSIFPQKAQAGAEVRLEGQGFSSTSAQPIVTINGVEATIISAEESEIVVIVPADAGTGDVVVKLGKLESKGPELLVMEIKAIKPQSGGAGTKITLTGSGFEEDIEGTTIEFNGLKGVVLSASATELVVRAPAEVSTGGLVVKMKEGNINGPTFNVIPPPFFKAVSPLSGPAGIEMTIEGENFSAEVDETHVFINNVAVATTLLSPTTIKLVIPAGVSSGEVKLIVNDQVTTGPRFTNQVLGISKLFPEDGMPGTEVTVSGTGFSTITTENIVTIGGNPVKVLSSTEKELKVILPEGLNTGKLRVAVGGLQAESPKNLVRKGMVIMAGNLNLANISSTLAVDNNGNVYVARASTQQILKITATGQVSVLAGSGSPGFADGKGAAAQFNMAAYQGLVFNKYTQSLFVSDGNNKALREISLSGDVKTVYSNFAHNKIEDITVGNNGVLYMSYHEVKAVMTFNPYTRTTTILGTRSFSFGSAQARKLVLSNGDYLYGNSINIVSLSNLSPGVESVANWFVGSRNSGIVSGLQHWDNNNILAFSAALRGLRAIDVNTKTIRDLFVWTRSGAVVQGDVRKACVGNTVADFAVGSNGEIYLLDMSNNAVLKIFTK